MYKRRSEYTRALKYVQALLQGWSFRVWPSTGHIHAYSETVLYCPYADWAPMVPSIHVGEAVMICRNLVFLLACSGTTLFFLLACSATPLFLCWHVVSFFDFEKSCNERQLKKYAHDVPEALSSNKRQLIYAQLKNIGLSGFGQT